MWCLCGNCTCVLLGCMYAKCRASEDAIKVYRQLQQEGLGLNKVIAYICIILKACAITALVVEGRQLKLIEAPGLRTDNLDHKCTDWHVCKVWESCRMHAKYLTPSLKEMLFHGLWWLMHFSQLGCGEEALEKYQDHGIMPNKHTLWLHGGPSWPCGSLKWRGRMLQETCTIEQTLSICASLLGAYGVYLLQCEAGRMCCSPLAAS